MISRDNPSPEEWRRLCRRPAKKRVELETIVRSIYTQVKEGGDSALLALTEEFDGVKLVNIAIRLGTTEAEGRALPSTLRAAVDTAFRNISKFHREQMQSKTECIETVPGVRCWREAKAIQTVGLYIPGGTAPLISTMLMLGVPAKLAGCKDIVVCTPSSSDGTVVPAIRYAAAKCGVSTIYTVGGAQAIAAMVLGTQTIPKVDKVFGPGNQYVTAAKQTAIDYGVAIDLPAGPSEVLIIADESATPAFVAADLLSQAEHGPDSQVVLVTTSPTVRRAVQRNVTSQLISLPRRAVAEKALESSLDIAFDSIDAAVAFANEYAPEHIIMQTVNAEMWAERIINAGSVFIGDFTPESAGDYASGTNHTLPTAGWAKSYEGVSLSSFQRMITFQSISAQGLERLADTIISLAEAEGLDAHARAVSIRQNTL